MKTQIFLMLVSVLFMGTDFSEKLTGNKPVKALRSVKTYTSSHEYQLGKGKPRRESHGRIGIEFKQKIVVTGVFVYMKNAPWPHNCDLQPVSWQQCPLGTGECPIGWCKVANYQEGWQGDKYVVSAQFINWSHCNARSGRIVVKWHY